MPTQQTSTASIQASYCTLCTIASGGMGWVDLAIRREGSFERLFAIKRLKPELLSDPEVRASLLDEARLAGLLRHPNVVSVLDVGEDARGPFLVMEYVEGVSAAELAAIASENPLPLEVCVRIARDVAEGLHAAHELSEPDGTPLGLVHRDISPQNILIGIDGVARVTDFGIAKALGRTSQTSTGILKGKLAYMAPEQLRFEEPDRRADLFALGVVLFELLTGRRLYKSEQEFDGPRRILAEPPPDLAEWRDDVEPELVELSFELLAKDRERRPDTAKAVARRLDIILTTLLAGSAGVETALLVRERFEPVRVLREAALTLARSRPEAPAAPVSKKGGLHPGSRAFGARRTAAFGLAGLGIVLGAAAIESGRAGELAARENHQNDEPSVAISTTPMNTISPPPSSVKSPATVPSGSVPVNAARIVAPSNAPARSDSSNPSTTRRTSPASPTQGRASSSTQAPARPGVPVWERY